MRGLSPKEEVARLETASSVANAAYFQEKLTLLHVLDGPDLRPVELACSTNYCANFCVGAPGEIISAKCNREFPNGLAGLEKKRKKALQAVSGTTALKLHDL